MAHIPRIIGGRTGSVAADKSECEPFGDGVVDLVSLDMDLGEVERGSEDLNIDIRDRERFGEPLVPAVVSLLWLVECKWLAKLEK